MNKFRRFYNQNRKNIGWVIIIIAFFLVLLYGLNYFFKEKSKQDLESEQNINTKINETDQIKITASESPITGERNEKDKTQIIIDFLDKCNNGYIEDAYSMLTEECKEELYSSLSDFKIYYCGNFFNEPRATFEVENWFGGTYKVNIVPDMLATGKKNNNKVKQDYITVIKTDNVYKLNVNNYIKRINVKSESNQKGITIRVNYKDIYMDYEKYNITVKNNSVKNIFLDTKKNVTSMYIEDKNGIKYPAATNEIEKEDLKFIAGEERTMNIKYYSKYISTKSTNRLIFSNVILDSDKYMNKGEKSQEKISINV